MEQISDMAMIGEDTASCYIIPLVAGSTRGGVVKVDCLSTIRSKGSER